ncbi:MAG: carboxyl transferase domain-containing protein [Hyphomonas sp.]
MAPCFHRPARSPHCNCRADRTSGSIQAPAQDTWRTPRFDSLLAKVIVTEPAGTYEGALRRAQIALSEIRIDGCATNTGLLRALLTDPAVSSNAIDTEYIDRNVTGLARKASTFEQATRSSSGTVSAAAATDMATPLPPGTYGAEAPLAGIVAEILVVPDQEVRKGEPVLFLEAMKMQHAVAAPCDGIVIRIDTRVGLAVAPGRNLVVIQPQSVSEDGSSIDATVDPDQVRDDLAIVRARHGKLEDSARPDAVSRRHARNQRTVRENIADLCDSGSFVEYGGLTIAAQRARRSHQELIDKSPADGMIAGIGSVNGDMFPGRNTQCAILAYDYTVFAGTQGALNHKKKDRMLELTARTRLPVIILGEGGGGRPGDTDIRLGLDVPTFAHFARLKNEVPIVGVVSGYCFAGNAALVGCADALIATRNSSIGMGGPAMIEGGGLGTVAPEDIGPADMQTRNGVIDILVEDEAEAVAAARKFLSYFQGRASGYSAPDQRLLRHIIPENRKRVFPVRDVIETLADTDSVLELRPHFGPGMITALIRIDGHPLGLIANNNEVMSGAIDTDAARKAADFLDLCNVHGLPVLSLCDTPGFMVGPEVEQQGQVKQACRMFVSGASLKVPLFAVVLRKAYGLGAQAMVGGCFHSPVFSVSWPTGEFGGMGLEGAVRLGYRRELEAISDEAGKAAFFDLKLQELYEDGKALTVAEFMEIDDVIDPAETRTWIIKGLEASAL